MTSGEVLRPIVARYLDWLSRPVASIADFADEEPGEIRAMPVILRIERAEPPARTAVLEAAASAAVAVCLDPRAEPGGEWHTELLAWTRGRIRKVARRARGAHWQAVQELPGRTVEVAGAQVRALVPGLVRELPMQVRRLQITGSDLPVHTPPPPPAGRPVLWLNPAVPMTVGKAAAQVGHGTMLLAALLAEHSDISALRNWSRSGFPCAVRVASESIWRQLAIPEDPGQRWRQHGVIPVRDAGFTEIEPGTVTVLAQWRS